MKKTHVAVLHGTGRIGARSKQVVAWVMQELAKRPEVSLELVEATKIMSYTTTVPPWGEGGADQESTPWKEVVARMDALLIVSPEYNHGYPGELKLLLDSLYKEYTNIPCGIVSVSDGQIAGARMTEQLRLVVIELGMVPMKKALHMHKVKETFDANGQPTDPLFEKKLSGLVDDLVWFSQTLKAGKK